MRVEIPTLRSERLVLRAPVVADFADYAAIMASPRAVGMGGPIHDRRVLWGMFCHCVALWPLYGHGALTVTLAGSGESVGQVGINHGPLFPEPELGWMLFDGHEGRGYATEAAGMLRDWAFAEGRVETLVSYMAPENAASIAVAERLGAWRDDAAAREDPEDLVYRYGDARF